MPIQDRSAILGLIAAQGYVGLAGLVCSNQGSKKEKGYNFSLFFFIFWILWTWKYTGISYPLPFLVVAKTIEIFYQITVFIQIRFLAFYNWLGIAQLPLPILEWFSLTFRYHAIKLFSSGRNSSVLY